METCCPSCGTQVEFDETSFSDVDCPTCGNAFSLVPDDETVQYVSDVGKTVGHFELLMKLGTGSFGTVWKALDTRLDRFVAVKIPRKGQLTQAEADKFFREARAVAQLHHPNIVSVHEVGRDDDLVYIVSDYVQGLDLADWLTGAKPGVRQSCEMCAQLADALQHAHEAGIIHRDLKPSNIMLDEELHPYIMDFGVAKRASSELTMTVDGSILGTPAYMPPEQAAGEAHTADPRSDVYSLGVVIFELLTGERPFRGNDRMILHQVINDEPPSPRKLNGQVPKDLETICLKCLEKTPEKRYPTSAALAEDLHRFLRSEPILARPISSWQRAWRWCRRNPVVAALTLLLMLTFLAGFVGVTTQWIRANRNAVEAAENAVQAQSEAREAEAATKREKAARDLSENYLYVAHMNLAEQAHEANDPARCLEILNRHLPQGGVDRRGFEWFYWRRLCQRYLREVATESRVYATAYSPTSPLIASAGAAKQITLWHASTGEKLGELEGHSGRVFALAFDRRGKLLASGSRDGAIKLWDADEKQEVRSLKAHQRGVLALAFSGDGQTLVSSGRDNTVKIWRVEDGSLVRTLGPGKDADSVLQRDGHIDWVYAVAISPNGKTIASCSLDRTVILWDAASGEKRHVLTKHRFDVFCAAFSPDGQLLATGSGDKTIRFWDVARGTELAEPLRHADRVRALAFSPSGQVLATAGMDRSVRLWDVGEIRKKQDKIIRSKTRRQDFFFERTADERLRSELKGHIASVNCLSFSADGKSLVSGSDDETIRLWDLEQISREDFGGYHSASVASAAFSEHDLLLTGSFDKTARWLDIATSKPDGPAIEHQDFVFAVATSPTGRTFATAGKDRLLRIWTEDQPDPHILSGHEGPISAIAFSPDGTRIASASHDAKIRIWSATSFRELATLEGHDGRVQAIVFLNNQQVVSGSSDRTVKLWDIDRRQCQSTWEGHQRGIWCLAVSPDGQTIASGSLDKTVKLWSVESGKAQTTLVSHAAAVRSVAFSPDGRSLATGSDDKTVKLWELAAGEPTTTFKGHGGKVWTVAFSKDGRTLASGSYRLRLWRAGGE